MTACDTPPHAYRYVNIIWLSHTYYNHFKVTNVRIVRTLFLTRRLFLKGAYGCEENDFAMKNFTDTQKIGFSLRSIPLCVYEYILCIQPFIFKQKYIIGDHMLTSSYIFIESSTLVSDLNGLMQRILCLIYVAPICNETMTLFQHTVLSKMRPYMAFHIFMQR